ncbi:MAG: malate/lactate/ureidoglycolate dehydrogenase [Aquabacterium sp.]
MPADTRVIDADRLLNAMRHLVRGFGSSEDEAQAVAANLVQANLTGHDSHGVGMLPRYADNYLDGGLVPNTAVRVVHDSGALLRLDGGAGFGQVVGAQAIDLAAQRARSHGSCIMALGNAHHIGRIGAWAEQAAAAGLVSLHFVNVMARAIVAPHGGRDARFGTNPVCIGVPLPGREPVILDFATSAVAQGKTRVAYNKGEAVAEGCLLDDQGQPSTDPRWSVVPPFGALLTFGTHKGYGLALACELLGGALAAGMTQRDQLPGKKTILNGMFSVLLDPSALAPGQAFADEALAFIDWVKSSPARDGFDPVQVAGDPERATVARRRVEGIPVDSTTWAELLTAADRLGVARQEIERLALG